MTATATTPAESSREARARVILLRPRVAGAIAIDATGPRDWFVPDPNGGSAA